VTATVQATLSVCFEYWSCETGKKTQHPPCTAFFMCTGWNKAGTISGETEQNALYILNNETGGKGLGKHLQPKAWESVVWKTPESATALE